MLWNMCLSENSASRSMNSFYQISDCAHPVSLFFLAIVTNLPQQSSEKKFWTFLSLLWINFICRSAHNVICACAWAWLTLLTSDTDTQSKTRFGLYGRRSSLEMYEFTLSLVVVILSWNFLQTFRMVRGNSAPSRSIHGQRIYQLLVSSYTSMERNHGV